MSSQVTPPDRAGAMARCLLWDLAGTLLVSDPQTYRSAPLFGFEEVFPRLARHWRMVVTTGEDSRSARSLLAEAGMMPYFEEIYGDLMGMGGKPHGEILRGMRGRPEASLVVGDRLRGDIPADSDELVLLLVGQRNRDTSAQEIESVIDGLTAIDTSPLAAFRTLAARSEAVADSIGPVGGGSVTAAWRSPELGGAELWIFEPDWLDAQRPVIVV